MLSFNHFSETINNSLLTLQFLQHRPQNGSAAALPPRLCVDGREFEPKGMREETLGGDRTGPGNMQNEGAAGKTDGACIRCGVGQDERGVVQRH